MPRATVVAVSETVPGPPTPTRYPLLAPRYFPSATSLADPALVMPRGPDNAASITRETDMIRDRPIGRGLVRKSASPDWARWPWRRMLITFAAVGLIILRKHDSVTNPQLWAEDGALFLLQADLHGAWTAMWMPYQGYLHFLPRVIAVLSPQLPLTMVPGYFVWACIATTGAVAWWLQTSRIRLPGAVAAVLAIGALPHTGEVYLVISNLQWITALALFGLLIADDATNWPERITDTAWLIVTGLTGPFILLALPLFGWRCWQRKTRWSGWLLVLSMICGGLHLPSLLAARAGSVHVAIRSLQGFDNLGRRLIVTTFVGPIATNPWAGCAILAVSIGFVRWLVWRKRLRLPGATMLLIAMVLVLAAISYKARVDTWISNGPLVADRYFFVPKVILCWLLTAIALESDRWLRVTIFAAFGIALLSNVSRFMYPPFPDLHWSDYAEQIESGQPTRVPILPEGSTFQHPGRPKKKGLHEWH